MGNRTRKALSLVACTSATLAPAWAGRANAQTSGANPPAAPVADAGTIGDIVVTANKRAENLQKVPLSIVALQPAALTNLNVAQTTDLPRLAPGLNFTSGTQANATNFVLRGVTTFTVFADGLESSVGLAVDGVPLGRQVGSVSDIVDVARIEVARGPQGMLFGKNATAGLINIITNKPDLSRNSFEGRVYYGNFDEHRIQGTGNVSLIDDKLALRVSAWAFGHDGYIDTPNLQKRKTGDYDSKGVRAKLRWKPTDTLDLGYTIERTYENDGANGVFTTRTYQSAAGAPGLTPAQVANAAAMENANLTYGVVARPGSYVNTTDQPNINQLKTLNQTLTADQELGRGTLSLITSYRRTDAYNSTDFDIIANVAPVPNYTANSYDSRLRQFTSELRYTSPSTGFITYVGGLFYYNLKLDSTQLQVANRILPVTIGRTNRVELHSENYAAFGEATLHPFDGFRILAGGRVSHDTISGTLVRTTAPGTVAQTTGVFAPIDVSAASRYTNFSWRAGLQYDVTPGVMGYFTASRGYKGPGLAYTNDFTAQIAASGGSVVKPELATAFEVGVKGFFFDRLLRLNVDAFHERFTNFQVNALLATVPANIYGVINAGALVSQGVEGEAELRPYRGLNLSGNIAYTDAHYTDFANAPCYSGQSVAAGCVGGVQNVDGQQTVNAPSWSGSATARYDWALSDRLKSFVQANVYYKGRVWYSVGRDPYERGPAYTLLNLTAGIRTADDRYGITAFGKNVTNQHYVSRIFPTFQQVVQALSYDSQATYGVAVDVKF